MQTSLLRTAAVRPRPLLRNTDKQYLRILADAGNFTREVYKNGSQQLRVRYNDEARVLTSAVFYDMLERGLIKLDHAEQGEKSVLEYYTISEKGSKILEGEDPYAPTEFKVEEPEASSEEVVDQPIVEEEPVVASIPVQSSLLKKADEDAYQETYRDVLLDSGFTYSAAGYSKKINPRVFRIVSFDRGLNTWEMRDTWAGISQICSSQVLRGKGAAELRATLIDLGENIITGEFCKTRTAVDLTAFSQEIKTKYPKCLPLLKEYGSRLAKNPRLDLEKAVVYKTLTDNGPDVSWELLGRLLPRVRKAVGGDILAAFQSNTLYTALDKLGMFGPSSDKLRYEGDKYY
jgi:hypothetical protein